MGPLLAFDVLIMREINSFHNVSLVCIKRSARAANKDTEAVAGAERGADKDMAGEWTHWHRQGGGGGGSAQGHAIGHSSYIINLIPMVVHLPFAIWSAVQAIRGKARRGEASSLAALGALKCLKLNN